MEPGLSEGFLTEGRPEPLFYRYLPSAAATHLLVVVHGFAEHSGRYLPLMQYWHAQEPRLALLALDLRGHGRSGGKRAHIGAFEDFWDDIRALAAHVQSVHGAPARLIFCGHSMGGLIVLQGLLDHGSKDCAGVLCTSPCLGIPMNYFLKSLHRSVRFFSADFYYPHPVRSADLTQDAEARRRYDEDPLVLKKISVGLLEGLLAGGRRFEKGPFYFPFPVFFLLAGDERVVDLKRSLDFYARLDAPLKRLRCFEGFRHEIFNEVRKQIAYDTSLDSIRQILKFDSASIP